MIAAQLGRRPRGVREIACRCPCGLPCVIETAPRLDDGVPFPTLYYLTCPKAVAAIGTLEASGEMRRMTDRLASDAGLRQEYQAAHRDYLERRDAAARAAGLEPCRQAHRALAACLAGSSACMRWPRTNWPCQGRTRSGARR